MSDDEVELGRLPPEFRVEFDRVLGTLSHTDGTAYLNPLALRYEQGEALERYANANLRTFYYALTVEEQPDAGRQRVVGVSRIDLPRHGVRVMLNSVPPYLTHGGFRYVGDPQVAFGNVIEVEQVGGPATQSTGRARVLRVDTERSVIYAVEAEADA